MAADGSEVDMAAAKAAGEQNKLVFSKADFASGCLAKRDDGTTCVWTYPLNEVRAGDAAAGLCARLPGSAAAAPSRVLLLTAATSMCETWSGWTTRTRWWLSASTLPCCTSTSMRRLCSASLVRPRPPPTHICHVA